MLNSEVDELLICDRCETAYPVVGGVPVLLTYRTKLHGEFAKRHSLDNPNFPDLHAPVGERQVQQSFTLEWEGLTEDALTFTYTNEELFKLHRDVFLRLDECDYSASVKTVLNLGVGAGTESEILSRIFPQADIVAVDINLSLLSAPRRYSLNPRLHFVIASVYALPFREGWADQVFTQGVIHHTRSTKEAFDRLVPMTKPGGHLFCWVYAKDDYTSAPGALGIIAKAYWGLEMLSRPVLCRLPPLPQKMAIYAVAALTYLPMRTRARHKKLWTWKNQVHSCFDTFAPRYAWRHSTNEVAEWFENSGFRCRYQSPRKYREAFGKRIFGVGINGTLTG